jgi:hypothetical protein
MVSFSTLLFVLENLEHDSNELIDVKEVFDLEEYLFGKIASSLNQSELPASPDLVNNILAKADIT